MKFLTPVLLLMILGCSSSPKKVDEYAVESYFRMGHYDLVIKELESAVKTSKDKDRILHLYDLAIVLHQAGQYPRSNEVFKTVEKEANIIYPPEIGAEIASIVVGSAVRFKLEDYEVILINYYKAMNYLQMKDYDGALVEIKKMSRLQEKIKRENEGESFGDTKFASYFSGLIYETNKNYDDALISYRRYEKEDKLNIPFLRYDLYKMAYKTRRDDILQQVVEQYKIDQGYKDYVKREDKNIQSGEIIVIFQNGLAPFKTKHSEFPSIPVYQPRKGSSELAKIYLNDEEFGQTFTVVDVEGLAVKNLENHFARHLGRAGARGAITQLGLMSVGAATMGTSIIAQLAIQMVDKPDLRSIKYLPANIQMNRMFLPAGQTYKLRFEFEGGTDFKETTVKVEAGQVKFVIIQNINY